MALRADHFDLTQTPIGPAAVRGNPLAAAHLLSEVVRPGVRDLLRDTTDAARGADALVAHSRALAGRYRAEALKMPGWVVPTATLLVPGRALPAPGATTRSLGRLNPATCALASLTEAPLRGEFGQWRAELGLPAGTGAGPRRLRRRRPPDRALAGAGTGSAVACHARNFSGRG